MPIKGLLYRFQPPPLYFILILTICFFSVQLILSNLTHSLTLLMASYHMLCNIFALAGSIVTIKHNELHNEQELSSPLLNEDKQKSILSVTYPGEVNVPPIHPPADSPEFKTRNTFGWARIEILSMLIVCITLASLSFSLLIEAIQTLVHIDHQDTMHLPVYVITLGFVGLFLNGFTYYFIGGYTLHQGSFLHINPSDGKVVVEPSNITVDIDTKVLAIKDNSKNDEHLKEDLKSELGKVHYRTRREGPAELLRDVSSTIFVIVCAVIVYFAKDKEHTAKFIDPVLAIFSCVLVVALSYPYMKEACLILLQTIPGSIDMENFEKTLVKKFPQIVSYHDLHIWQLSSQEYIATIHIIFQNSQLYSKTIDEVRQHFHDHRIANVTIQPEFYDENSMNSSSTECLVQCTKPECLDKVCCKDSITDLREVSVCSGTDGHEHGHEHGHGHAHDHVKKSCSKSKKHKDHHGHGHSHGHKHGHSHKHDHSHGLKHDHSHDKYDHTGHKHDKVHSKEIQEVLKEEASTTKSQINDLKETTLDSTSVPLNVEIGSNSEESTNVAETLKTSIIITEKTENAAEGEKKDSEITQDATDKEGTNESSTKNNTKC